MRYSALSYLGAVISTGRPLIGTNALLAHGPTNAHGGVNFNRVRPNSRVAAGLGLCWPMGRNGMIGRHAQVQTMQQGSELHFFFCGLF